VVGGMCFLGLRSGLCESLEGRYVNLIWFQLIKHAIFGSSPFFLKKNAAFYYNSFIIYEY
jgi:hypothetical protein